MIGIPNADIAWEATQEYTSRQNTPQPSPAPDSERKKRSSSGKQTAVASPLRKASFPFNERLGDNNAITDDDPVIHVSEFENKPNKITGGGDVDGAVDLSSHAGNTEEEGGWFDERGDGTPILASDEITKRPGSAYMHAAVNPEVHHDDYYYESDASHNESSRRNSVRVPSRPSSRPNSMHGEYHGGNLYRFMSHEEHHGSGIHTPLEEIEEYEPLIPEDEEDAPKPKPKAINKRPGLEHHHFPSQDVWEDTPLSLQYSTTVETPEPPREARAPPPADSTGASTSTFETPEAEQRRRSQNPNDMWSNSKTLWNKPHARALDEHRPGAQRFPSQDIWEDTPDSMRLVTTVSGPQMDEAKSPPDDRPTTAGVSESPEDQDARATTGFTQVPKPSVPTRPQRKSKLAEEIKPHHLEEGAKDEEAEREVPQTSPTKTKPPSIPERPKPSVPSRPARTSRGEQAEGSELTKSISAESPTSAEAAKSPPVAKAKPAIPARPAGEKIAAMKAGFMSDLNNRLKLGPTAPPSKAKELEPEMAEEAQKEPLADARKGRAKGPARRKPAASPSASATSEDKSLSFSMSSPFTLWHIDEEDELQVPSVIVTPPEADLSALEKQLSANEAHNTEEPTLTQSMSPERAGSPPMATLDDKLGAAQESIDTLVGKEQETAAESEAAPTTADVEVKEVAPVTTNEVTEPLTETPTQRLEGPAADEVVESGGVA